MDKQKIGFIGALAIVLVAVVGGIYLAAKGVAVPAWLASLLAVIGPAFAWYAKPPGSGDGAAKAVGLLLALALGSSVSACSWLRSGNHAKDVASILTCISGEAAAGKSPGEIALTPRDMVKLQGTGTSFDQTYYIASIDRSISFDEGFRQTMRLKNTSPRSQTQV